MQLINTLRAQYRILCKTELHHVNVVKFAVSAGEDRQDSVTQCSKIPEAIDMRKVFL